MTSSIPKPSQPASRFATAGGHRRVEAVQIERDVEGGIADPLIDEGHGVIGAHLAVAVHGDHFVAKLLARLAPIERARVAAHADLHAAGGIDVPVAHQIARPMRRGLHRPEEMRNLLVGIGMGVEVQEHRLPAAGQASALAGRWPA